MNLQSIIDQLMPDPARVRELADALRKAHPEMSTTELAQVAVRSAKFRAATAGAATGAASSPITMIPAALADMAAVLKIEGTLVGVVAALVEPTILDNPTALRADVMTVVFPAAASQALRQVGIRAGERITQAVMRKYVSEDLLRTIMRLATGYAGKHLTRDAIATKAVPLVGMGIGAGWNWLEVQAIGTRAIRYYNNEPIGPSPSSLKFPDVKKIWPKVSRFLPGRS